MLFRKGGKKVKKRIIAGILVVMFLLGTWIGFRYLYNEYMISRCKEEEKFENVEPLLVGNWIQPYVAYYNKGNLHYQNEEYEKAIEEYKTALESNPEKGKECSIRINLALAMIKNMGEDYAEEENRKASIETLKEAREVLLEESCATEQGDGHSETAEKLKKEIEDKIKELEKKESAKPEEKEEEKKDPKEEKEDDSREQDLKEQLQQQQKEAYKEREEEMEANREFDYGFDFDSDGRVW